MHDITEQDEHLDLAVTTEPALAPEGHVNGRAVQMKITNADGSAYRTQFDLKEGELKWISVPVQLVGGNVRVV